MRRPRTQRRCARAVAFALGATLTAACGSTVQAVNGGDNTSLAGPGLGASAPTFDRDDVPADVAGPTPPGLTGGPGTTLDTPRATSSRTGQRGPLDGRGGRVGDRTPGGLPTGPGVTATTIALGIPYCNDCAAGNAAIGAGGEDPGDVRRYHQAALDDVNARGGALGRKLVPVFHEVSINDTNLDAAAQASCETFTSDNKVLLMLNRGDVAYECAQKAGVVVVGPAGSGPTLQRFPNLFAPAGVRLERLYAATVRSMTRAKWHEADATWPRGRIGLLTWDDPQYRFAMTNGYLKALQEAGLRATDVRYIGVPQGADSLADAGAAISSAVLRFQQQGIDHVYIGDGPAGVFLNAGLTFLFLNNARSQQYYPRYAFNSNNDPDFESHPQDQLVGMLAIDASDHDAANDEGLPLNPVRERCFSAMRARGLPVGGSQTRGNALEACGFAWFAEAVLDRATSGTTLPLMIKAAESLGTSYRSPSSYGNRIGAGQHDGAALFRELRFDTTCSCVRYTSTPFEP